MKTLQQALTRGAKTLSEHESKQLLAAYGIPVTQERVANSQAEAAAAASQIGYPVVLKGHGEQFSHKTELNLIALDLEDERAVLSAFERLTSQPDVKQVLVQQMVKGDRELVMGLTRDAQFGPCVMFGLGGVLTETLNDVAFRVAPLSEHDALAVMEDIRGKKILEAFRGQPPVDRQALARALVALGQIGIDHPAVREIDVNPLKILNGQPIAVDALVVLDPAAQGP